MASVMSIMLNTVLFVVVCSLLTTRTVATAPVSERTVVPFRYGWRFHYGPGPDDAPGPGNCEFSRDLTGMSCDGMEHNPNRFTNDDCRTACCYHDACMTWTHDGNRACYWGGANLTCSKAHGYTGGGRASFQPIKEEYTYSATSFDHKSWQQVDIPHDSLINGTFKDNGDDHHGYLPRNVSWYRKEFTMPKSTDQQVWVLEFEGTFHFTQIWVNGVHVMDHELGYTPYAFRLDNLSSVTDGGNVVIVIRTDASYGSGHW